jgi:hypothetical protein
MLAAGLVPFWLATVKNVYLLSKLVSSGSHFIIFHEMRHPQEIGIAETRVFLAPLTVAYSQGHSNVGPKYPSQVGFFLNFKRRN